MLVFSKAGCGIFKELIAGCGMEHVNKDLQKTAIKPHSARSLLSLLIRDVLFWYTVLGDDPFSLK